MCRVTDCLRFMSGWRLLSLVFIITCGKVTAQELKDISTIQKHNWFSGIATKEDTAYINSQMRTAHEARDYYPDSAVKIYRQVLLLSKLKHLDYAISASYIGLGIYHFDKGLFAKSREYYEMAKQYATPALGLSQYYLVVGNLAFRSGQYDSAAFFYYKIFDERIEDSLKKVKTHLSAYNNLSAVLARTGKVEKALQTQFSILKIIGSDTDTYKSQYISALTNISHMYKIKEDYKLAESYCLRAWKFKERHKIPIGELYRLLGDIYVDQEQPAKGIPLLLKSLEGEGKVDELVNTGYLLGRAYETAGNYAQAEKILIASLKLADSTGLKDLNWTAYNLLLDIYAKTGRYKEAYNTLYKYLGVYDSLNQVAQKQAVSEMEGKYNTAQKDKELMRKQLLLSKQENKIKSKNLLIGGITAGTVLALVLLVSVYKINAKKQQLQANKIRVLQQEKQIDQFKALIEGEEKERVRLSQELHDGVMIQFSTVKMGLSNLQNNHERLAGSEDFQKVLNRLDEAIRELRKTAHHLMPDMLLEEGLAEGIYYFCRNLKETTHLNIDFQVYGIIPKLNPEFELSVYRIVQELIQNAIKHANATYIIVQLSGPDEILSVTVEDGGKGFDPADNTYQKGMGFKSIGARVSTFNGHIKVDSGIGTGTTVYLEFDMTNPAVCRTTKSGNGVTTQNKV